MLAVGQRPDRGTGYFLYTTVHVYDIDQVFNLSRVSEMQFKDLGEATSMADAWTDWYMNHWRKTRDYNKTIPPLGWNREKARELGIEIRSAFPMMSRQRLYGRLRSLAHRLGEFRWKELRMLFQKEKLRKQTRKRQRRGFRRSRTR